MVLAYLSLISTIIVQFNMYISTSAYLIAYIIATVGYFNLNQDKVK